MYESMLRHSGIHREVDGRWQFTDGDPTNAVGNDGAYQAYVIRTATNTDWGLIHELTHQLGVIDMYRLNMPPELAKNDKLEVRDRNGQLIPISLVSPTGGDSLWEHPGLMGGGNIQPYIDGTDYDIETAAALNTHAGKRRGYFGEYLFDMPQSVSLKIIDQTGAPYGDQLIYLFDINDLSSINYGIKLYFHIFLVFYLFIFSFSLIHHI